MMDMTRRHTLAAINVLLQALPDDTEIVIRLDGLPRAKYDAIRQGELEDASPKKYWWFCTVEYPADVKLELSTSEPPPKILRSVG